MIRPATIPVLFAALAACAEGTTTPGPTQIDTLLVVRPAGLDLAVGETRTLEALHVIRTVSDPDTVVDTVLAGPVWTSRDPTIAAVDDGVVSGVAAGVTHVVAAAGDRADSAVVTVREENLRPPALQELATGLAQPVFLTAAPGDPTRLFVVEKTGTIRILRNDTLLATPFLDLTGLVAASGEQGLLSMAFHPGYATNGRLVVSYTDPQGTSKVVRYHATGPETADPASAFEILSVSQPYSNHNGGQIAFGPDGMLYVGLGDGGSGGDPLGNGQNTATLLGAILRLDVDGGSPYAIPADNPLVGQAGARGEIWAYGLRNPWRFSFDRSTGVLFIADVGQSAREEVDVQPADSPGGENYGWSVMEGSICYGAATCDTQGLILPAAEYTHAEGCSITGGYVYRGTAVPVLQGRYLYADYCQGWIRSFTWASGQATDSREWEGLTPGGQITSFGEDGSGEVYVMTLGGKLYRITAN